MRIRPAAGVLAMLCIGGCATPGDLASAAVTGVYSPERAVAQLVNRRLTAQGHCRDCLVNCRGRYQTKSAEADSGHDASAVKCAATAPGRPRRDDRQVRRFQAGTASADAARARPHGAAGAWLQTA